MAKYKPGWFATWNDVEDDKMEALAPMYRLERVAAFPAFDDPERNLLILYRLDAVWNSPGRRAPAVEARGRVRAEGPRASCDQARCRPLHGPEALEVGVSTVPF